jgi:hypothetical protein
MKIPSIILASLVMTAIGCGGDTGIQRVGYFKDDSRNRIYTFSYTPVATSDAIGEHAATLPYTPGQMLAAYFYPEGSTIPADGVTLAKTLLQANDVLYETPGLSRWRYAFMRSFSGEAKFVDCQDTPKDDLCRK